MFFEQMHASWQEALRSSKPLLDELEAKLQASGDAIAPPMNLVMRAFSSPLENVRVLIVGQDPYPTPGHAVGLSFAVAPDVSPLPRSLANIVRELSDDLGKFNTDGSARKGDLSKWADQGVLLLNRHLTTNLSETAGHLDLGWARFTDQVVAVLNRKLGRRLVSVLWGAQHRARRVPAIYLVGNAQHNNPPAYLCTLYRGAPRYRTQVAHRGGAVSHPRRTCDPGHCACPDGLAADALDVAKCLDHRCSGCRRKHCVRILHELETRHSWNCVS